MLLFKLLLCVALYQRCKGNHVFDEDIDKEIAYNDWEVPDIDSSFRVGEDTDTSDVDPETTPDEEKVTDADQTTENEEDKVTDNEDCPPDKSLYSKKDIGVIIDYIFKNLNFNDTLVSQLVPEASVINEKHTEEFMQFESWFTSKPADLLNVLQGLSSIRKGRIEPEAQKIAIILNEYPQVKELVDEKQTKMKHFMKKLNKYDNLCKYACDDSEPVSRIFKRSVPDNYVCISIGELHDEITSKLKENFDSFLKDKLENIHAKDNIFAEEINNIKKDLKETALNMFGRTMYDVLNLQDEFHSFVKEMNSTKVQGLMYDVKNVGLQVDSKLLQLERLIEEYGQYCRNCSSGPVRRFVRQTNEMKSFKDSNPVLDELIQDKFNQVSNDTDEILEEIFKNLTDTINDPETKDIFLNKLKLLEDDIVKAWNIEKEGLDQLKSIASQAALKQLTDLHILSEALLKSIEDQIARLQEILNIYK